MNTSAILMMLLAMIVLWGGLVVAIIRQNRSDRAKLSAGDRDL